MKKAVFLKRVALNNYKSIKVCGVSLGPLTFLVGPNGAGKSNFLDALRLTSESLNTSLEQALRDRGGINEVRRRSFGSSHAFWRPPGFPVAPGHYSTWLPLESARSPLTSVIEM